MPWTLIQRLILRASYMLRIFSLCCALLWLCACASVPPPVSENEPDPTAISYPNPDVENPGVIIIAQPVETPAPAPAIPAPPAPTPEPPEIEVYEYHKWYTALPGWSDTDHRGALTSFKRSCESFAKADPNAELNPKLPEYGRYKDWAPACAQAGFIGLDRFSAQQFFETQFEPLVLATREGETGLLTGYYEPEVDVRKIPDAVYSEPILAKPISESIQTLPRAQLGPTSSRVIAYGKPIEVFFMQIQGSGRIRFADGTSIRAAYAGHNSKSYQSIGKVLVERGELSLDQASKQSISDWMDRAGPAKARALMNENPRYIFFAEQAIGRSADGVVEGPRGAMRVPLTNLSSIAVDPRYHPYGTLVWLETTLPQYGGDFRGQPAGLLVSVQDTGSAIKGPLRGDLFFGAGDAAGDKAGVMKHDVRWTILVPHAIAPPHIPAPLS